MQKSKKRGVILAAACLLVAGAAVGIYFAFFFVPPEADETPAIPFSPVPETTVSGSAANDMSGGGNQSMPAEKYDEINEYYKIVNALQDMNAGTDYIEYEVVCPCGSKGEGKKAAQAIGGTLKSYSDGVAIIEIPVKVYELMLRLAEAGETAVTVSPNYIYSL